MTRRRLPREHAVKNSMTVLLVDEDVIVLDLTRQVLEQCGGYRVLAAHGFAAADALLEAGRTIDVLIVDVGGSLADDVYRRAIERSPAVATVFVFDAARGRPRRAPPKSELLAMPYGIQQLLDAVARAIASVAGTRNGRAALAVPQGRNSRN
jgi:DNA-binding NtrC family response regulator